MSVSLWSRITTGLIIIVIGALLLLSTTDTVEVASWWAIVPALFVVLGLFALIKSGFRNLVGPVMVIAIAGAFLLRSLGIIDPGVISTWWPLFIILFGVLLIINRSKRRKRVKFELDSSGELAAVAVFGSADRRIASERFADAEVAAIFGDVRLDLRDSTVVDLPAIVDAVSIFGDVELVVPEEWAVELEVMTIFGDTTDRRPRSGTAQARDTDLVVSGVAIFGDIAVRD